jgi:hypothetical protein
VLVDRPALERAEGLMKASGLFNTDQIRPVIEARMWARWKLGQLLAKFQRGTGPGRGKKEAAGQPSFKQSLATLGLNKNTAKQAERIGAMPKKKVERYLARCHRDGDLCSYKELAQRVGRERPTRAAWAILSTRKTDTNGRLIDAGENAPLSLHHRRHERFIPRGEFARDDPSPGFGTGGVQGPSTRLLRALGHRRPAERGG